MNTDNYISTDNFAKFEFANLANFARLWGGGCSSSVLLLSSVQSIPGWPSIFNTKSTPLSNLPSSASLSSVILVTAANYKDKDMYNLWLWRMQQTLIPERWNLVSVRCKNDRSSSSVNKTITETPNSHYIWPLCIMIPIGRSQSKCQFSKLKLFF